jgi:hypothetical protein
MSDHPSKSVIAENAGVVQRPARKSFSLADLGQTKEQKVVLSVQDVKLHDAITIGGGYILNFWSDGSVTWARIRELPTLQEVPKAG